MVTSELQLSPPVVATPVLTLLRSSSQATVMSSGQVIIGGSSSTTVMICSQLERLPQESVAIHVRVISSSGGQLPAATLSLSPMLTLMSQLSVAVATPVLTLLLLS
jgi:hypothetical protein